jgi:hypothetical protein
VAEPQITAEAFAPDVSVPSADGRVPLGIFLKVVFGVIQEALEIHAGPADRATDVEISVVLKLLIGGAE